jgi:hypothetical protein
VGFFILFSSGFLEIACPMSFRALQMSPDAFGHLVLHALNPIGPHWPARAYEQQAV